VQGELTRWFTASGIEGGTHSARFLGEEGIVHHGLCALEWAFCSVVLIGPLHSYNQICYNLILNIDNRVQTMP
jgi:hypothetical protein